MRIKPSLAEYVKPPYVVGSGGHASHYLDNAATGRPCREAIEAVSICLEDAYGNPSSLHAPGRTAMAVLEQARADVAATLDATPSEITFTAGGTESCNLGLMGAAGALRRKGRHIVVSSLEHPAVSECAKRLSSDGFELSVVPPDRFGRVSVEGIVGVLRPDTVLVSVVLVSGENGAVNPVAGIAEAVRLQCPEALIHADAVQALCRVGCSTRLLGVDMLSVSAHKIGGIKGAGALWRRSRLRLNPVMLGGGQEGGMRPGTEPMPAIAAFGAACRRNRETHKKDIDHMDSLKSRLLGALHAMGDAVLVIPPHDAPQIVAFSLPGYPGEVMLRFLSDRSVFVSTGAACRKGRRSDALASMGLPPRVLDGVLRVSLSPDNTDEDIDALIKGLGDGIDTLVPAGL